jgi:TonB family protein
MPPRVKVRGGGIRMVLFLVVAFCLCRTWMTYHKAATWDYQRSTDWHMPSITTGLQVIPLQSPPVAQQLTYGQGEARQPPPVYPAAAVVRGEQGVVVVRFVVDETGRVVQAGAATPCPWPLLNDAAVAAVRDTWRFGAGPVRTYEVPLRFELVHR